MRRLLLSIALFTAHLVFGQNPFDGTWKTSIEEAKLSPKAFTFSIRDGIYDCSSCAPAINVKANGESQHVSGQIYDTITVKSVTPNSIQIIAAKGSKTVFEQVRTVSNDESELSIRTVSSPNNKTPVRTGSLWERVGKVPPRAHPVSGSWAVKKATQDEDLLESYRSIGDELHYTASTGEAWAAKIDGKDYPVTGSYATDAVFLKKITKNILEVNYKRDGQLIQVDRITVSADGKTMNNVVDGILTGRTTTYISHRQ